SPTAASSSWLIPPSAGVPLPLEPLPELPLDVEPLCELPLEPLCELPDEDPLESPDDEPLVPPLPLPELLSPLPLLAPKAPVPLESAPLQPSAVAHASAQIPTIVPIFIVPSLRWPLMQVAMR